MPSYGSTQTIITRQGATPDQFGFGNENNPQDALENFIDELRARASSDVEEHCERVFGEQTGQTETIYGNGTDEIGLDNYPVTNINSVTVGQTTLDADQYQLQTMPGRPDRNAGIIERTDRRVWPKGRKIVVDYDWGFGEVPGVVKQVVEDMVVEVLEKAAVDRNSSTKSSESMDGYSVSWDNSDVQDYLTLDEAKRKRLQGLERQGRA
jgi:hypothetical protein